MCLAMAGLSRLREPWGAGAVRRWENELRELQRSYIRNNVKGDLISAFAHPVRLFLLRRRGLSISKRQHMLRK